MATPGQVPTQTRKGRRRELTLLTLEKIGGWPRPVAVGETLRRLTAKSLLATVPHDMTLLLHPRDSGTPSSTQSADGRSSTPRTTTENAFNQIEVSCIFREVRLVAPGLATYSDNCCNIFDLSCSFQSKFQARKEFSKENPWARCFFGVGLQEAIA